MSGENDSLDGGGAAAGIGVVIVAAAAAAVDVATFLSVGNVRRGNGGGRRTLTQVRPSEKRAEEAPDMAHSTLRGAGGGGE